MINAEVIKTVVVIRKCAMHDERYLKSVRPVQPVANKMLRILLLLTLSFAVCTSDWLNDVSEFTERYDAFKYATSSIIKNIDDVINGTTSKAQSYLDALGSSAIFKEYEEFSSNNPGHRCLDNVTIIDTLEPFPSKVEKLQMPLKEWKQELQRRLFETGLSINLTVNIAYTKQWLCKISGIDCTADINRFVEEQFQDLNCKELGECDSHREKRSYNLLCGENEFECNNDECISGENVCNGYKECSDGSDEPPECTKHCFGGFHCRNLKCLGKKQVCDGTDDCGDGSDEDSCAPRTVPEVGVDQQKCISDGGFFCDDRTCVPMNWTCDGTVHCKDQSDELGLCQMRCGQDCPTVCLRGPRGPVCLTRCPEGFKQVGDTCERPAADLTLFRQLSNIPLLTNFLHTEFRVLLNQNEQAIRSDLEALSACVESSHSTTNSNQRKQQKEAATATTTTARTNILSSAEILA